MASESESLKVFRELGMTLQQAKVYLALSKLEQATVKAIAMAAQTERAEVYRVIPELQKLGLIKKIISTPIAFRATPLAEGLKILLHQNTEKHKEISRQVNQFLRNWNNHNGKKTSQDNTQYNLTTGFKAEASEFQRCLAKTQTSRDCISDWRLALYALGRFFEENIEILERGVKIRFITCIPEDEKIPQNIQTLMKTGSFELKCNSTALNTAMDIIDKKKLSVVTVPSFNLKMMEVLRSNKPEIVGLAQNYFDMKWQTATTPRWHKENQRKSELQLRVT